MGVEPTYAAWEAAVLPMNYIRNLIVLSSIANLKTFCKTIFLSYFKLTGILHF